jgi:hypothetical protein
MTSPQPPRLATWILRHFGVGPSNDSLLGDLAEEYSQGRTRLWYWREVATALILGFAQEIKEHKWLAMRAVAVGWGTSYAISRFLLSPTVVRDTRFLLRPGGIPWIPILWLLLAASNTTTGWIVARFHRASQRAMLFAYVTSVIIMNVPEGLRLITNSLQHPRYVPYLTREILWMAVCVIGTIAGGLADAPHEGAPNGRRGRRVA